MHLNEETRTRKRYIARNRRLSVIPLPKSVSNPFRADARFQTALLYRTLLTTAPSDVYGQLFEFARSVSAHVSREGNVSSPRWRSVSWLASSLAQTPTEPHLKAWPAKVRFLTASFLGHDPVRSAPLADAFRLTDAQWQVIDETLAYQLDRDVGEPTDRRNAFEAYMHTLIHRAP